MKKKPSISYEDVLSSVAANAPKKWIDKIDKGVRADLEDVRRKWIEGGRLLPPLTVAKAIVRQCREVGIRGVPAEKQMYLWLRQEN